MILCRLKVSFIRTVIVVCFSNSTFLSLCSTISSRHAGLLVGKDGTARLNVAGRESILPPDTRIKLLIPAEEDSQWNPIPR